MRFTDEEIAPARRRAAQLNIPEMIEVLREQPGRWAEVGRYPLTRIQSARSRGSQTVKRYPILEYAVREQAGVALLLFRVPSA